MLRVKPVPQAPAGVAGLFSYRGMPVPVVDLSALMLGRPAPTALSTRLIVVRYGADGSSSLLGLIAEQATATFRRRASDFAPSRIGDTRTASAGPVTSDEHGVVQWLDVNTLLPPHVRDALSMNLAGGVQ
jgi:chemotaxis-related protein WspB